MRTSIIHVNSANRSFGDINDFHIFFKDALFKVDDEMKKAKIILEPIQCVICRSWYSVDIPNNTFELSSDDGATWVQYVIPPGNYNIKSFMYYLRKEFPTGWAFGWKQEQNYYYLQPPDDDKWYKLRFNNYSCTLFGFGKFDVPRFSYFAPLFSTKPVNMERSKIVLVNSDLQKSKYVAVDNVLTQEFQESNIILKIPIDSPPWSTLVWRANSKDVVSFELSVDKIDSVRFWITDENNQRLNLTHEWTMSFRITYLGDEFENIQAEHLANISDYLRYMILDNQSVKK